MMAESSIFFGSWEARRAFLKLLQCQQGPSRQPKRPLFHYRMSDGSQVASATMPTVEWRRAAGAVVLKRATARYGFVVDQSAGHVSSLRKARMACGAVASTVTNTASRRARRLHVL